MIVPWGTDAPIYHRPIATVAIIIVNAIVFVMLPADRYDDWTLVLGSGIHPAQWLTSNFVNANIFHLVSNMFFLWTFGLLVEGKLGWWAFTLLYLGLGASESAGVQLLIHPETPIHIFGASGVIFSLLAVCVVWAPLNEVLCIIWLRFTPSVIDVSILWFVAGYIALDIVSSFFEGAIIATMLNRSTTALLALALHHTTHAILGFIVATALLRLNWVDCEHWDLFAVLAGRKGQSKAAARRARARKPIVSAEFRNDRRGKPKRKRKKTPAQPKSIEDAAATARRRMSLHLELGEVDAALAVYQKSSGSISTWQPTEAEWVELIQALIGTDAWGDAARVMRDYLKRSPSASPRVRLKLAQVLVQKLARPAHALSVLGQIPEGSLPRSLETLRRKLVQEAEHMREEGDLELQDEMW